jgi:hypothetical protein
MTETPETNEQHEDCLSMDVMQAYQAMGRFARKLERERDEARKATISAKIIFQNCRAAFNTLKADNKRLHKRIQQIKDDADQLEALREVVTRYRDAVDPREAAKIADEMFRLLPSDEQDDEPDGMAQAKEQRMREEWLI